MKRGELEMANLPRKEIGKLRGKIAHQSQKESSFVENTLQFVASRRPCDFADLGEWTTTRQEQKPCLVSQGLLLREHKKTAVIGTMTVVEDWGVWLLEP